MCASIDLVWSTGVAELDDLLKVIREIRCNRASLFVLLDMTALVRQEAMRVVIPADIYSMAERKTDHSWAEQSDLEGRLEKHGISWQR